jgi:hypothetical protein
MYSADDFANGLDIQVEFNQQELHDLMDNFKGPFCDNIMFQNVNNPITIISKMQFIDLMNARKTYASTLFRLSNEEAVNVKKFIELFC